MIFVELDQSRISKYLIFYWKYQVGEIVECQKRGFSLQSINFNEPEISTKKYIFYDDNFLMFIFSPPYRYIIYVSKKITFSENFSSISMSKLVNFTICIKYHNSSQQNFNLTNKKMKKS